MVWVVVLAQKRRYMTSLHLALDSSSQILGTVLRRDVVDVVTDVIDVSDVNVG